MLDLVVEILRINHLQRGHYAEPYAGGAGLALSLLFGGHVGEIHINDLDRSIWSFWDSVLNDTDAFVSLIEKTPVTIQEWRKQQEIYDKGAAASKLKLGFSAFFLNRTNRSGIIKGAGAIGGIKQDGNYKIDCRFNKEDLIRRIRRISRYRDRIHLYRKDAVKFLSSGLKKFPERTFFCIDPPYFNKGSSLYTSFYNPADHEKVASAVLDLGMPWIVTYDNEECIRSLYNARRQFHFDINYSLNTKRVGTELMIASKGLRLPTEIRDRHINGKNKLVA